MWLWPKKSKVENFYEAEIPCTGFCLLAPLLSQSFDRCFWWQCRVLSIFSTFSVQALTKPLNVFFSSVDQHFQRQHLHLPTSQNDQELVCFSLVQYLPLLLLPGCRLSCCYSSLRSPQFPCPGRSLHISCVLLSIC